jgi:hypothetical protein
VVPAPLRRHRPEHQDGAVRLTEHRRHCESSVQLRPLRRRSGLLARPAGSASFTAGPRYRFGGRLSGKGRTCLAPPGGHNRCCGAQGRALSHQSTSSAAAHSGVPRHVDAPVD